MVEVTVRDVGETLDDLLDRVERGATVVITRDRVPVAELRPLPRPASPAAELIARRRHVPPVDPQSWRADNDAALRPDL